jgi:uncharacterized membrane protein
MTVQPPGPPQAAPQATPPPVADRRAPERRSGDLRRAEDRAQLGRVAGAAAVALCGGLAIIFVFFWLLGAIDVTNAVGLTIVAVVLAAIWGASLLWRRRKIEFDAEAHRTALQDRERRGF